MVAPHQLFLVAEAQQQLRALPASMRGSVRLRLMHLASNPRPGAARRCDSHWEIDDGEARILYVLDSDDDVVVLRVDALPKTNKAVNAPQR